MSSRYSCTESNTLCFPAHLPQLHLEFIYRVRGYHLLCKLFHCSIVLIVRNLCIIFNWKLFGFGLKPEKFVMFLSATLNSPVVSNTSSLDLYIQIIFTLFASYKLNKLRKACSYYTFQSSVVIVELSFSQV